MMCAHCKACATPRKVRRTWHTNLNITLKFPDPGLWNLEFGITGNREGRKSHTSIMISEPPYLDTHPVVSMCLADDPQL
jgi:hypothetical protein